MTTDARSALVVGGGRGIGRAIAAKLAEQGVAVGLVARTAGELDETTRELAGQGARVRGFAADVLNADDFERAVGRFLDWAGSCDTLVYAAGRLRAIGPLAEVDEAAWWEDVSTSLLGFPRAVRSLWGPLKASGRGTVVALVGPGHAGELAFGSGYAAAQAGLVRLVECLDREGAEAAIRVFAVNPGIVPTAFLHPLIDTPEGRHRLPRFNEALAEGKEVGPEVAAEMVAWLTTERPEELAGRVVAALTPPAILATRLGRIREEDLGRLRLR